MKRLLGSLVLLWLCYAPALAQENLIPRGPEKMPNSEHFANPNPWELTDTRQQVLNRLLSTPGWRRLELPNKGDSHTTYVLYGRENETRLVSFEFFDGELYSRMYTYLDSNIEAKLQWDAILQKLPYDEQNSRWFDERVHASFTRRYLSGGLVAYNVEMYPTPGK